MSHIGTALAFAVVIYVLLMPPHHPKFAGGMVPQAFHERAR